MTRQRFESVWDAIEDTPQDAAVMKIRSSLLIAIEQAVESWGITKAVAARRLGVTTARLNDLLHGKIAMFSIEELVELAVKAGLKVQLKISHPAKAATAA